MRVFLLAGLGLLTLAACSEDHSSPDEAAETGDVRETPLPPDDLVPQANWEGPAIGTWGIDLEAMDLSVDPGDDFYRYVNGTWLDSFEIPAEFSNYGTFTMVFERAEAQVKAIIEEAAESEAPQGPLEQKIGDYYASYLDTGTIEAKGLEPIRPQLEAYAALGTHEEVALAFADPRGVSVAPFALWVDVDNKNPERYVVYLGQSGLGLPNRDYYLKPEFAGKKEAYKDYLVRLMELAGLEEAPSRAAAVYALEARLAAIHWAPAKRRNADLTYNLYTRSELESYIPGIPWTEVFAKLGIGGQREIVLRENDALKVTAEIFTDTPVEVWSDYLTVHALSQNADVLPGAFDDARFAFYGRALSGTPSQKARWKRGVEAVNNALGEAVGRLYVDRHFPPESKADMERLVDNLMTAFEMRLDELDWMTEETKQEAREKLASFNAKIGYPEEWTDYDDLDVIPGDAFGNKLRAQRFAFKEMTGKLGGPVDPDEWFMTPQTVNAYYSRNRNEIVFPAAILQAPFFDPQADPAVNYGAIGAVIGHEIGHGFDDQGRKADGRGMQRDWWTAEDAQRFNARAARLGEQYAAYAPVKDHYVDPDLTMGENIGDLGGLTMAYRAYKLSRQGEVPPIINGFTGDQRFFMAWAQIWRRKYREDELKRRLVTDPHSPSEFRTNGVVRNMDAWYTTFEVDEDDDLYLPPEERVRIW